MCTLTEIKIPTSHLLSLLEDSSERAKVHFFSEVGQETRIPRTNNHDSQGDSLARAEAKRTAGTKHLAGAYLESPALNQLKWLITEGAPAGTASESLVSGRYTSC